MAKVTITIEDAGGQHVDITVESEPPLPIAEVHDPEWLAAIDGQKDLDVRKATPAQTAARLALQEIANAADAAAIVAEAS